MIRGAHLNMTNVTLVLNAGSSSLKFACYGEDTTLVLKGKVASLGRDPEFGLTGVRAEPQALGELTAETSHEEVVQRVLGWLTSHPDFGDVIAVGHRVVHGGRDFSKPVLVTEQILDALSLLEPLAPSHQPHNLAAIRAVRDWKPKLPQVACFDTGFHASQPEINRLFGLPMELSDQGVLRYGFHGLSYEYIARTLPRHLGQEADGRVVVAHLGNGASMCALNGRRSVATTMGFSALEGLVMGRRCGRLDPGVLIYLQQTHSLNVNEIEDLLYKKSGLQGVSGISNAMQVLEASSDPQAQLAIDLFCARAASELAAMLPAIGGLDAIVFTAGIGENSARVRSGISSHLSWLGVELDSAANTSDAIDIGVGPVRVLKLATDEEGVIASHVRDLVAA